MGSTTESIEELLALHDAQLRGRLPVPPPVGGVVEQDGPVVRIHYGTHATIDHRALPTEGLDELIARQRDACAARGEPVEWKVYAHDSPPDLPQRLRAAGFIAGWERSVLVAPVQQIATTDPLPSLAEVVEVSEHRYLQDVALFVAGTGPQPTRFTEFLADGRMLRWADHVLVARHDGRIRAAAWAEYLADTNFVSIGGITDPELMFADHLCAWDWQRSDSIGSNRTADRRYVVAEADGALQSVLETAGMRVIATVTAFHWIPEDPPAKTRPVRQLLDDPEHNTLWDRFYTEFEFRPSTTTSPGITEPTASATWHLGALDRTDAGSEQDGVEQLQRIISAGLLACRKPGEVIYWLDWHHAGYRFDPSRVGGTGQPNWPGSACPDGDYYIYLTPDFRLGTFGHPWEYTLCVFGDQLLAEVEAQITDLLGAPIRRGGRSVGNTWAFGTDAP
ncbi:DUF2716 domain-containing protein [Nocardia sp. GCM10030253]|uniref:DUF2716 domain-containing protein n=1 Tax=Nocardia sp. GCM10030253 TaxID=3273404 RepID=UPI00363C5246